MSLELRMFRSRSAGFTLIELLIVVVIVGILAAVAIPQFTSTKGKAYISAMKSDLRNLATAEESYFYYHDVYIEDLALLGVRPSANVDLKVEEATGGGWSATATHPLASGITCALFVGNVAAAGPATVEGTITCQ
jgi:prepilin-type N-terminal cleavage/methylation domain-containing protein